MFAGSLAHKGPLTRSRSELTNHESSLLPKMIRHCWNQDQLKTNVPFRQPPRQRRVGKIGSFHLKARGRLVCSVWQGLAGRKVGLGSGCEDPTEISDGTYDAFLAPNQHIRNIHVIPVLFCGLSITTRIPFGDISDVGCRRRNVFGRRSTLGIGWTLVGWDCKNTMLIVPYISHH